MMQIEQNDYNMENRCISIIRPGTLNVDLNKKLILRDIDKLNDEIGKAKNVYNINNMKALKGYLLKILKSSEDGKYEFMWCYDKQRKKNSIVYTYPLQVINEPLYNIKLIDYIELGNNEKMATICYKDMIDIITFEIVNRDLGEDHDSIENILYNCGVTKVEDSHILTDYFKSITDDMFALGKSMMIGESSYRNAEHKTIQDYFGTTSFNCKGKVYYKDTVEYSCKYANILIMSNIAEKASHYGISIKIVDINPVSMSFIINENEDNIHKLLDSVSIRSFGRRFLVTPEISVL